MYPELVTRPDLSRLPAAHRRHTIYVVGDIAALTDPRRTSPAASMTSATAPTSSAPTSAPAGPISCTASRRREARRRSGGVGVIVYNRKEGPRARRGHQVPRLQRPQAPGGRRPGRDLFRAHRMRRRRPGRPLPAAHARRAALARHPPHRPAHVHVEHEIRRHGRLGIEIVERVPIPDELIPPDASVEMEAKKAAGYYAPDGAPTRDDLRDTVGRPLERY
jgi:hypothetical protein